MMVACVAFDRLDSATRAKVDRLLRLHPDYPKWTAGIQDDEQRMRVAMMRAATWPDEIKQDRNYTNDGENPTNPDAGRNTGYDDHLQHRYWHYIDLPLTAGGAQGQDPPEINAQERLLLFLKTMAIDPGSDPQLASRRSYDLVWVLHLIGDIHQPLHCASRFTPEIPKGDQGGLKVNITPVNGGEPVGLHFYWDRRLGTSEDPDVIIKAAADLPRVPQPTGTPDVVAWVKASWQVARKTVYAKPIGLGAGPYALTAKYDRNALTAARRQIALAGARLALVLESSLK
jgi:hypothetical protein